MYKINRLVVKWFYEPDLTMIHFRPRAKVKEQIGREGYLSENRILYR